MERITIDVWILITGYIGTHIHSEANLSAIKFGFDGYSLCAKSLQIQWNKTLCKVGEIECHFLFIAPQKSFFFDGGSVGLSNQKGRKQEQDDMYA